METWARPAWAAYTIDSRTPASTPWRQTVALSALYLIGALISYWPSGSTMKDRRDHAL